MRVLLVILVPFLLGGCSASNQSKNATDPTPSWVQKRPSQNDYYLGIGSASKRSNPFDYSAIAKQSALEELANEISVHINANSVLSQTENKNGFEEAYQSQVNLKSQIELEGFDVVDSWENAERFYVYYRLNKREWLQRQEAKKKKALSQSQDWYFKALRADSLHRAEEALNYYVKALEAIDQYLGEPLEWINPKGATTFYGNDVYYHLAGLIQGLQVNCNIDKKQVKQGTLQSNEIFEFYLTNSDGQAAVGLPVLIKYSEQLSRGTTLISDKTGKVAYPIPIIQSGKRTQYIQSRFDADQWLKEATDNRLVRGILEGLSKKVKETIVELDVLPPTFSVVSIEKNLGQAMTNPLLGPTVRSVLLENGFATDPENPDYEIRIETDSDSSGTARNMATSFLNGSMIILNKENEVFRTSFHEIKGVQLNYESAGKAAYREGSEWLSYEVLPQWIDRVRPTR